MNVQTIFLRITLILFLAFTIPMMKAQKGLELETLENLIKESLVTDFLTSATFVEDDTIFVYIKINKSEPELRRYLSERNISHYDKEKFINLIDSIGFNSEPYKDIDYDLDVYSAENPIFSFQKGWIASSIGTDGRFNDIIDIKVTYLSDNGKPVHQQLISSKLLAIVRQLKQNKFAVKTISKLIANKTGIDAGVLRNKKMVPYQVDFMTEMTDIELTDSTYIYKLVIPQFTSVLLSESEYKEIGNSLEEQLGSYVDSMPFFKMDGASLFGIEIIYSYKTDETGDKLVTYRFNPYTKRCVIEMPSSNSENMDKYNADLQSNLNSKILYSFQINGKSGYFDDQCNIVVPPKFDQAGTFLDGMGMVRVGSKFGYVNIKGEFAIEPQFEYAWYFSGGLAAVKKDDKYGIIDKTGNFVIQPQYDYAEGGSEGVVLFEKDDKWGFVAEGGSIIVEPVFESLSRFCDGLACFTQKGKMGYIDVNGKTVIKPIYEHSGNFSEGLAAASNNEKIGFINNTGEWVIQPKFDYDFSCKFSEGLAAVSISGKWGYIDKSGSFVILPQYDRAYGFSDGLAAVKIDGLLGFIDKEGNMIIEPEYDMTFGFENGIAQVLLPNWKEGFIDKYGRWYDNKLDAYRAIKDRKD